MLLSIVIKLNGGRSSVAGVSEFNSEDAGFDLMAGQGHEHCVYPSESTLVQTCLCLIPPPSLRVYGTHPNVYAR